MRESTPVTQTELVCGVLLEKGKGVGKRKRGVGRKERGRQNSAFKRDRVLPGCRPLPGPQGQGQMCLDVNTVQLVSKASTSGFFLVLFLCVTLPTHSGDKGSLFRKSDRNGATHPDFSFSATGDNLTDTI